MTIKKTAKQLNFNSMLTGIFIMAQIYTCALNGQSLLDPAVSWFYLVLFMGLDWARRELEC